MILLIVCVVIAAVLFLVWGVKQNKFGKYYWCYAIAFGLTILTCFIHVHQMYHWTVIFVDIIAALTWGIAGIVGHRQNRNIWQLIDEIANNVRIFQWTDRRDRHG